MVLWHLRERVEKGHVPKKEVCWSLISQGNSDWPGVFQSKTTEGCRVIVKQFQYEEQKDTFRTVSGAT